MISALIGEFKQELTNTRKILERIPQDHFGWRPHEKSMSLLRLATHVTEMIRWASFAVQQNHLDFSKDYPKNPEINTTEDLLVFFDQLKAAAISALEGTKEEVLVENWTLKNGEHIYFTMPKAVVLRSMVFNHIIHHRGQLTVYLRMLNVPIPGMYGPSADEK